LETEAEKIIEKAMRKINEKIEKSSHKPKLNKVISKYLISPLFKLWMVEDEKLAPLLEIIKNPWKDMESPCPSTKSGKLKKEQNDKLLERINQLEIENKALKFDLNENSKMFELQVDSFSQEKQKMEDLKKEMSFIYEEEKKNKEDVHSKVSNYKTRIFFLESQVEELEKKIKEVETDKSKIKSM